MNLEMRIEIMNRRFGNHNMEFSMDENNKVVIVKDGIEKFREEVTSFGRLNITARNIQRDIVMSSK